MENTVLCHSNASYHNLEMDIREKKEIREINRSLTVMQNEINSL